MNYSIKPEKHDLENARNKINHVIESYNYAFEINNIEFYLNWQNFESPISFDFDGEKSLILIINPEMDWEDNLEEMVLRGVFTLEFMQKAEYSHITFGWQELLLSTYAHLKTGQILEENNQRTELTEPWNELKEKLSDEEEILSYDGTLYENFEPLRHRIGQKLLEKYEIGDIPKLKRSDIIKAGDEVFQ